MTRTLRAYVWRSITLISLALLASVARCCL